MNGIADYRFVRELRRGNHGTFWLAETPQRLGIDDAQVVVKVLDANASDDDFRRMANELKVYAAVPAPELLRLYDAGHQSGTLYYAAEYLPHGSLAAPADPADPADMYRAVAAAARAAHALHEVGVAHRDIKPENIWLLPGGAKLGDLGLAQVLNPGQTVTGVGPLGAIEYLSPEIVRGDRASRATDIWALGATLHRALTGHSVYPGLPEGNLLSALRYVVQNPPVLDGSLSPAARGLIGRCTEVDPAQRFGTADELSDALTALAEAEVPS